MWALFLNEFKLAWINFKRYPSESLSGVFSLLLIFYGLFLGASYMAGGQIYGDRLEGIVVGYIIWTLLLFVVGQMGWSLMQEAQAGTLEQVFLTAYGPVLVYLARSVAGLLLNLVLIAVTLVAMLLLTGTRLNLTPEVALPAIAVIFGAYGIGFAVGALALVYKRVQQLLSVLQFVLLFLVMVPVEDLPPLFQRIGFFLPMTPGTGLLRRMMAQDQPLDFGLLAVALLNGAVYFALGVWAFAVAVRLVKRRGALGGY